MENIQKYFNEGEHVMYSKKIHIILYKLYQDSIKFRRSIKGLNYIMTNYSEFPESIYMLDYQYTTFRKYPGCNILKMKGYYYTEKFYRGNSNENVNFRTSVIFDDFSTSPQVEIQLSGNDINTELKFNFLLEGNGNIIIHERFHLEDTEYATLDVSSEFLQLEINPDTLVGRSEIF